MWSPPTVGPALGLMRAWPRAPKFIIHNDASETLPEPHTLQQMSPWSQPWKMCRVNTATPAPGPSAGSSCQHWGPRTPRLAALLLLLLPGEEEHRCRLREQVEKDSELKRGSCRQPVWWQQWDPKETPDGFEDEKQSLVPAKPLSSPSFSLFLRAVASAAELQPAAEEEQWAVVEVELAPALLTPPPLALEPVSPPPAVLEVEQGPTWAPAGVGAA
ncbi:uncharacterized protein LOC131402212 isoform X1 [Diceros bicornis minor]|uniref:uncharacterized protein LOC131402212 isoform X1 n=1 Tax=Diceros bicornis minor TaxID=77932 RepID=UPI0026F22ADD|nr:uncharacterized protein LOC131402212 isoform X1 [Diceros bicornis minor]